MKIPSYWIKFRDEHQPIGADIEIPEDDDISELGADITIFDDTGIISEATEFYPGIEVAKHGFIPIGGCACGSGDPYFIRATDGPEGALYRIYHDMVFDGVFPQDDAVAVVLDRYADLIRY